MERRSGVLESEKLQFGMFRDLREMFIRGEEVAMMRNRSGCDEDLDCACPSPFSNKLVLEFRSPHIVFPGKVFSPCSMIALSAMASSFTIPDDLLRARDQTEVSTKILIWRFSLSCSHKKAPSPLSRTRRECLSVSSSSHIL